MLGFSAIKSSVSSITTTSKVNQPKKDTSAVMARNFEKTTAVQSNDSSFQSNPSSSVTRNEISSTISMPASKKNRNALTSNSSSMVVVSSNNNSALKKKSNAGVKQSTTNSQSSLTSDSLKQSSLNSLVLSKESNVPSVSHVSINELHHRLVDPEAASHIDELKKKSRNLFNRIERISKYEHKEPDCLNCDQKESVATLPILRCQLSNLEETMIFLINAENKRAIAAKALAAEKDAENAAKLQTEVEKVKEDYESLMLFMVKLLRELIDLDPYDKIVRPLLRQHLLAIPEDPTEEEEEVKGLNEEQSTSISKSQKLSANRQSNLLKSKNKNLINESLKINENFNNLETISDDLAKINFEDNETISRLCKLLRAVKDKSTDPVLCPNLTLPSGKIITYADIHERLISSPLRFDELCTAKLKEEAELLEKSKSTALVPGRMMGSLCFMTNEDFLEEKAIKKVAENEYNHTSDVSQRISLPEPNRRYFEEKSQHFQNNNGYQPSGFLRQQNSISTDVFPENEFVNHNDINEEFSGFMNENNGHLQNRLQKGPYRQNRRYLRGTDGEIRNGMRQNIQNQIDGNIAEAYVGVSTTESSNIDDNERCWRGNRLNGQQSRPIRGRFQSSQGAELNGDTQTRRGTRGGAVRN